MWDSYRIAACPAGWIELSENGRGAIAAWYAGSNRVVRAPMGVRTDQVQVTCEYPDGSSKSWSETFTPAEVEEIEKDIDSYLHDSRLRSRPHGYRWFMRLPPKVKDEREFWGLLGQADAKMPPANRDLPAEAKNLGQTIATLFERTASKDTQAFAGNH
ncbi:hypothetical protein CQ018_08350 [Arthrobacter sp. MYb227]|uniref:DUF5956 family protein n=1 Tax=Arthrobacter sp. MYb227 TaxID=1848601 RepID=UPI000CFBEA8E|nr:DUF5956 family protein [Arthrobacter sp. MYb227]PQZ93663.1 hypothetical protein CQ018_08350 [Arthrobacter sp. MYb227]